MKLQRLVINIFFILYLILPEYFAFEISSSLPLLTAGRVLLIFLILTCFAKNWICWKLDFGFMVYFWVLLSVDIYHLSTNSAEAVKAIFTLIIEQIGLYVCLKNLITSKKQWLKCMDIVVKVSAIVSVLGLIEVVTGFNVFYVFSTTSREMLQASYERLGVLRAEAGFGHPVYFSVYLTSVLPFSLYFYENTKKVSYVFIGILNIFAIFSTGSRGGIVVLAVELMCFLFFKNHNIKNKYFKMFIPLFPMTIVLFACFPSIFSYAEKLSISLLTALGLSSTKVSGFGMNSSGISSRLMQFTGITWAKEHDALLMGFGPRAHMYGLISYINPVSGNWHVIESIDIGYVGYILNYGIIGVLGYMILYVSMTIKAIYYSNEKEVRNVYNAFKYFFIAYLVSLLSSTGEERVFFLFTIMMLIHMQIEKNEKFVNGEGFK